MGKMVFINIVGKVENADDQQTFFCLFKYKPDHMDHIYTMSPKCSQLCHSLVESLKGQCNAQINVTRAQKCLNFIHLFPAKLKE